MQELIKELEPLKQANQSIAFHHTGDAEIWSDRQLLRNIVSNLVSNALKYTSSDDGIQIETSTDGCDLIIRVTDHGMGIPQEERKHIFKRFYRAQNASHIQGTGLGLNIVKKYVRLLGGTVSFESKVNEGSTFTVMVPAKENVQTKKETL